ncbi:MAG: glycosyltransferase family 2 protein, partial [Culicoidibacterales bacterium]
MKPIISVIVPIYNVELYLEECLQSLAQQSQIGIEYLLIDDGSTDRSGELANQFASEHEAFTY